MTGWQGNEGGWNPQQDPQGGQYGGGGQGGQYGSGNYGSGQYGSGRYGGEQYGSGGYGADPHGSGNYDPGNYGSGQYGTGQYGSEQYGTGQYGSGQPDLNYAYGGGGYDPGYGPPPKKTSKLPIILSIAAIVAIVGTVITIVLLNRNSDSGQASGPAQSSSSKPASTSKVTPPSSRRPPSASARPGPGGSCGTTISVSWGSHCVPSDWTKNDEKRPTGLQGVDFQGDAVVGVYDCGGRNYFRGFSATGEIQGKNGAAVDVNQAVADFGKSFAGEYYRNPVLAADPVSSTTAGGTKVTTQKVRVTVNPTAPDCEAAKGEVAIAAVPIEEGGRTVGAKMLVVVIDLAGGPASPKALTDQSADQILGSLRLK